jgi:response regulator NasT
MADSSLRILIVGQNLMRASVLEEGLREAGLADVVVVQDMHNLLRRIVDADPDVIFIDLENPHRDVLEQMFLVARSIHRPVAMFVDSADASAIEAAVGAGVGAYVVDGLRRERVKGVLELCVSRFNAFSKLRDELDRARQALEERKLVDRAKGIIMKQRKFDEQQAFALLRKSAMQSNLRLGEAARSVITAAKLLQ